MKQYKVVSYEIITGETTRRKSSSRMGDLSSGSHTTYHENNRTSIKKDHVANELEEILQRMASQGWELKQIVPLEIGNYSYQQEKYASAALGFSNTKYLKIIFEK